MEKLKETSKPSTFAQDYMREELEKKKLERKHRTSAEKQARKDEQFALRQQKKREKQKGRLNCLGLIPKIQEPFDCSSRPPQTLCLVTFLNLSTHTHRYVS